MLGGQTDTVIILFTVTRNVVLAPIIGQVRRATIVQRHLKLNKSCKVRVSDGERRIARAHREGIAACCGALEEKPKPEAMDQPIAAQAAQA